MISGVSGGVNSQPLQSQTNAQMPSQTGSAVSPGYQPANTAGASSPPGPNTTDQMGMPHQQSGALSNAQQGSDQSNGADDIKGLLEQLLTLLSQLLEQLQSSGGGQGAVTPDGGGPPVAESGGNGGGSDNIPKPTEHVQTINLGGKEVTIGGDGTASAQEVQQTADTMQRMYQTSPSFRQQIDGNQNASLEVSVGRRSDNTSWGNPDGRIFMNINNVSPTTNDTFESLVSHEIGHTQGMDHGSAMEALQERVAAEAA